MPESEHSCGLDGEWTACIDGAVYGGCDYEQCGGICEFKRDCECPCHNPQRIED